LVWTGYDKVKKARSEQPALIYRSCLTHRRAHGLHISARKAWNRRGCWHGLTSLQHLLSRVPTDDGGVEDEKNIIANRLYSAAVGNAGTSCSLMPFRYFYARRHSAIRLRLCWYFEVYLLYSFVL